MIAGEPLRVDKDLHLEQHLYRKHLHTAGPSIDGTMLMFLIAFVSFTLGKEKRPREGT